jgi:hypothetical protein
VSPSRYTRPVRRPASKRQRYRIAELAKEVGIEVPVGVFWAHDASKLIDRLELLVRQPSFDFRESPVKEGAR